MYLTDPDVLLDELRSLIDRHADRPIAIDGLKVSRADRPEDPTTGVARPVLAVVAQGSKRLTLGDRIYDYGAGQYLVVSVDLPVAGHYTRASPEEPFLACGFALEPAKIASLLLDAGADPLPAGRPHTVSPCATRPSNSSTRPCGCYGCSTVPATRRCSHR